MRIRKIALVLSAISVVQSASALAENETQEPDIKPWGYPMDAFDHSVRPGDNFFKFANGGWLEATDIPADRSGAGFSVTMSERNEDRLAAIIADLAQDNRASGDEKRIRDLFYSYMDTRRIEARGLDRIERDLSDIADINTYEGVVAVMGDPRLGLLGPFGVSVWIDSRQPTQWITWIGHDGLGLPDRSYYLRDDERLQATRVAYETHIADMLMLAEVDNAVAKAAEIFALETAIAELHWPLAERRDANRTYNLLDRAELAALAPEFPWNAYLNAAGLGEIKHAVVQEKEAFPALAALFAATPVETWKAYLTYHLLRANAQYLPAAYDDEHFKFFGAALNGRKEQRARVKRGIELINNELEQAIGKIYIERYFPDESKAQMTVLFANVRAALRTRIENLSWMTDETKVAALEKLDKMSAKIAYPETWRTYTDVRISRKNLLDNIYNLRAEDAQYFIDRLSQPVDKSEWFTGPQTVNAFYSPARNEAFIPAGYIQSPLFDPYADPALNYGAIGSIIGHEIGHGFDDQGSKYDGDGVLRDWWTEEDRAAFDALGDALAAQFDAYEPLPGVYVNGRQTLGENIGDLAGVVVAYHAYLLSLDGEEPPVLDGFTGQQRLFLGRAQGRRFKRTDEALRRRLLSAPHSPMELRVNGMVRNIDEWYEAFDIQPDDEMYLAPEDRVRIW